MNLGLFFFWKHLQTIYMRTFSHDVLVFFAALSLLAVSSCTVYRSPERKDFEAEYAQFKVTNLQIKSCSQTSVVQQASASKLVYIEPENYSIWEHQLNQTAVFESNNFKGEYCLYEYINSDI
jgi:hypothetical protein